MVHRIFSSKDVEAVAWRKGESVNKVNTLFLSFAAITNSSDIVSAKWTVAGLGVFEAYVNGVRVGGEEYDARIKNPVLGGRPYQERVALRGRKVDMGFLSPPRQYAFPI